MRLDGVDGPLLLVGVGIVGVPEAVEDGLGALEVLGQQPVVRRGKRDGGRVKVLRVG